MSRLHTGVDLVEIERVARAVSRHGARFTGRIFTAQELAQIGDQPASLAARFAAKEAVAKALHTGIGDVGWLEIEVLRGPAQEPVLHLHGAARRLADERGLHTWSLSISHTHSHAIAFVVALGDC